MEIVFVFIAIAFLTLAIVFLNYRAKLVKKYTGIPTKDNSAKHFSWHMPVFLVLPIVIVGVFFCFKSMTEGKKEIMITRITPEQMIELAKNDTNYINKFFANTSFKKTSKYDYRNDRSVYCTYTYSAGQEIIIESDKPNRLCCAIPSDSYFDSFCSNIQMLKLTPLPLNEAEKKYENCKQFLIDDYLFIFRPKDGLYFKDNEIIVLRKDKINSENSD